MDRTGKDAVWAERTRQKKCYMLICACAANHHNFGAPDTTNAKGKGTMSYIK
jgi:hypothetical protein